MRREAVMAGNEKKAQAGKSQNQSPDKKKKGSFLKKIQKNVGDIRLELKRVTWPTWRELLNYTTTVLFVCAVMGVLIYVLDLALSRILLLTLGI
jgi:preprotein translocase subunit SecE